MKPFEPSEYRSRIGRVQARMRERGLDLLFVTTPENIYYLSGYCAWSFYTHQALLLTPSMDEPVLVLRDMDVACAEFTAFLKAENVIGYPERYVGGALHPVDFTADTLRERCGPVRRIGIESSGYFFPVQAYEALKAALPGAQLVDSERLVNWARIVKSPAEIAIMRQAGDLAGRAIDTAFNLMAPGVRGCDVAAEIYRTIIRGTPQYGGSVPTDLALVSGARTAAPHIAWTEDPFEAGTQVNLELGGSRHQYHAGLSRSISLGEPKAAVQRLAEAVCEGLDAALAAVRPGVTCHDVDAAWKAVIARHGYEKTSRIGYSIGIGLQPTWLEDTASLQAGDHTVLEPGMTFHVICGMWRGDDNFIVSETVCVTPNGHEQLTHAPRGLLVKR